MEVTSSAGLVVYLIHWRTCAGLIAPLGMMMLMEMAIVRLQIVIQEVIKAEPTHAMPVVFWMSWVMVLRFVDNRVLIRNIMNRKMGSVYRRVRVL
jgi:hypothetical protein